MPTVAGFIESAKALLLAGDAAQATTVCRHVLSFFPKHIEANCLLGEALRDLGDTAQAKNLFLRVVSADPSNLVAHWALGLIAESEGDSEWAAWELARAWDSNPGYAELRGEILRVTGTYPTLTALGLGQQYSDAGLYDKSIAEFRLASDLEPDRLDVLLALACSLWRDGQAEAASSVCERILADSPDSLGANLILGAYLISQSTDGVLDSSDSHPDKSQLRGRLLLERASRLEPSGVTASSLLGSVPTEMSLNTDMPPIGGVPQPQPVLAPDSEAVPSSWLVQPTEEPLTVQAALEQRLASAAANRPDADLQALRGLDPSWQSLLTQEITLDSESEIRLKQALQDAGGSPLTESAGEGWREIATGATDSSPSRSEASASSSASDDVAIGSQRSASVAADAVADVQTDIAAEASTNLDSAPLSIERATARWQAGRVDAALDDYRSLLGEQGGNADYVVESLRRLIAHHRDNADAHRLLGDAYMRAGRFQQAIDEYNWVLAKN